MKDDGELAQQLLRDARTIAVVGITSDTARASFVSYGVAKYLIDAGYDVYLVNPAEVEDELLGRPVYDRLQDVPAAIDIVDVFRRPEAIPEVVEEAIAAGARAVWTQLEIVNEEAAQRARDAGLAVVMDRCTRVEHGRLQRNPART
jgi:predicted CoA-binding protein